MTPSIKISLLNLAVLGLDLTASSPIQILSREPAPQLLVADIPDSGNPLNGFTPFPSFLPFPPPILPPVPIATPSSSKIVPPIWDPEFESLPPFVPIPIPDTMPPVSATPSASIIESPSRIASVEPETATVEEHEVVVVKKKEEEKHNYTHSSTLYLPYPESTGHPLREMKPQRVHCETDTDWTCMVDYKGLHCIPEAEFRGGCLLEGNSDEAH